MSPLVRLCVSAGLAYCSYAMCRLPVLPLYARSLGASPQMVGLVVGASTITGVLLKLPAGALSDVFGRKVLLLTGLAVYAFVRERGVRTGRLRDAVRSRAPRAARTLAGDVWHRAGGGAGVRAAPARRRVLGCVAVANAQHRVSDDIATLASGAELMVFDFFEPRAPELPSSRVPSPELPASD